MLKKQLEPFGYLACDRVWSGAAFPSQIVMASQIPLDTRGNPMPIPVSSGYTDHSSLHEWRRFWANNPSGTGALPRNEVQSRKAMLDFSVPATPAELAFQAAQAGRDDDDRTLACRKGMLNQFLDEWWILDFQSRQHADWMTAEAFKRKNTAA